MFSILRMTFQERIQLAFKNEQARRGAMGGARLTKTELWKGVGATSAAATHWFNGSNGMDLDTCMKAAKILNVNPYWLFDESKPMDAEFFGINTSDQKMTEPKNMAL